MASRTDRRMEYAYIHTTMNKNELASVVYSRSFIIDAGLRKAPMRLSLALIGITLDDSSRDTVCSFQSYAASSSVMGRISE